MGASTTWPQAIEFDEEGITRVVANINELVAALPAAVQKCLARFPGVDRPVTGYEGLIVAQECVRDNAARDRFAADYGYLAWFWESTDPSPESYEADYRWLSQVCESVKPSTGAGKLLWHTLWIPRPSSSSTGTSTSTPSATIRRRWRRRRPGRSARGWPNPTRSRNRSRSEGYEPPPQTPARSPPLRPRGATRELRQKREQGLPVGIEFVKSLRELARDGVDAEPTRARGVR